MVIYYCAFKCTFNTPYNYKLSLLIIEIQYRELSFRSGSFSLVLLHCVTYGSGTYKLALIA